MLTRHAHGHAHIQLVCIEYAVHLLICLPFKNMFSKAKNPECAQSSYNPMFLRNGAKQQRN